MPKKQDLINMLEEIQNEKDPRKQAQMFDYFMKMSNIDQTFSIDKLA